MMRIKKIFLLSLSCLFFLFSGYGQELKSYQIYNHKGNKNNFGKMIRKLKDYDVVLFGEYHNNSILHWLQLKTAEALYRHKQEDLILAAEMFERDNQDMLDAYISGELTESEMAQKIRLWNNYQTDYASLVEFSKERKLAFIASNVPRKYAQVVARFGQDSLLNLPENEKKWMVALPYKVDMNTPGYEEIKEMMGNHAGDQMEQFIAAQAIKDATMAESIAKYAESGKLILHFNGDFHSKAYGGIYWYLKKAQPDLKIAVISVIQSDYPKLKLPKDFSKTEFTIVVPEDMTKTY